MTNRINLGKKIYNILFDPVKILDNRQNLGKVQFHQMILGDIITHLLIILRIETDSFLLFIKICPNKLR